jgi:TolA-binding protein
MAQCYYTVIIQMLHLNQRGYVMKAITTKLAVFVAAALISAMPVLAETGVGRGMDSAGEVQKDECLLASMNCRESVDSIQQRIDRINREIRKGTNVYTNQELRSLQFQLRDAVQTLEDLTRGGA